MGRGLLLNAAEPEEIRAALLGADGRLEEFRHERTAAVTLVGNVYLGRVVNIETGIGAAFVDIGVGRNAFLHSSDCPESDGARIEDHAALGATLLVQVTRDSIGSKGPVLTANVSLPGRFVVLLPCADEGGISRRIDEGEDKSRRRAAIRGLEKELGVGLILRTAAADRSEAEVEQDARRLLALWNGIVARSERIAAPARLFAERDLVARALRDMVDDDVQRIVVDTPEALARAQETIEAVQPGLAERLELHDAAEPLFHAHGIESEVDRIHARRVSLPSGGSLVFDSTEAMVTVDVNSGRTRTDEGLEETALRTNLEAAPEVARQLRLRDLGGVVAVDFIDMKESDNVAAVDRAMRAELRKDRAHVRSGSLGPFAIFLLTRQRAGDGAGGAPRACRRCAGTGRVVRPEEVALRVWRELVARAAGGGAGAITAHVSGDVAEALQTSRAAALEAVSDETGRPLEVSVRPQQDLPDHGCVAGRRDSLTLWGNRRAILLGFSPCTRLSKIRAASTPSLRARSLDIDLKDAAEKDTLTFERVLMVRERQRTPSVGHPDRRGRARHRDRAGRSTRATQDRRPQVQAA